MYVRAVLEEGVNDKAFLVPQKTVIRNSRGLPMVQLLTKNATIQDQEGVFKVESRMLETDRPMGNNWLVTGGLKDGDRVILDGLQKVRPGMLVKGVREQDPAGAASQGAANGEKSRSANATQSAPAAGDKQSATGNGTRAAGSAGGKQ